MSDSLAKARIFRQSAVQISLRNNSGHQFALAHGWRIYPGNALYTMIPKNGCSSLRYSIALANGCITGAEDKDWIHRNNSAFVSDTEAAALVDYAFVVLRCPFRRLLSAFYDKIVGLEFQSWELWNETERRVHPHDVTFADFVDLVTSCSRKSLNQHWRPQTDFLLYRNYDDVFAVERFGEVVETVERRIGLAVVDTREEFGHHREGASHDKRKRKTAWSEPAIDLLNRKRDGVVIEDQYFFNDAIVKKISDYYAEDIAFYDASGFRALRMFAA